MSFFHQCPYCGRYPLTTNGLDIHVWYAHRDMLASPPQPMPATPPQPAVSQPRRCLICEGPTHGADAFCGECQAMPEDERHTAVKHLTEIGEITDWSERSWSHNEHMTDAHEGKGGNWRAQLVSILSEHDIMLDDSGRE